MGVNGDGERSLALPGLVSENVRNWRGNRPIFESEAERRFFDISGGSRVVSPPTGLIAVRRECGDF